MHWDGLAWAVVPRPPGGALRAVTALAADNAWAVGDGGLILHWDGTAWSSVPAPAGDGRLTGILSLAADNIWAVGSYQTGGVDQTLTLHWDGTAWAVVASPSPPSNSHLYGVAATATNDVWAVGEYYGLSDYQTLVFHWDGAAWTLVASPNTGWDDNTLHGVATLSPDAVWAVGTRGDDGSGAQQGTLTLHYAAPCVPPPPPVCAADWQVVASPSLDNQGNSLRAIAAVDAANIWAVGYTVGNNGHPLLGLIEHWDGAAWTIVPGANLGPREHAFYGVAARTAADVWAVGARLDSGGANQTLVEHWDGAAWSSVPIRAPVSCTASWPSPPTTPGRWGNWARIIGTARLEPRRDPHRAACRLGHRHRRCVGHRPSGDLSLGWRGLDQ